MEQAIPQGSNLQNPALCAIRGCDQLFRYLAPKTQFAKLYVLAEYRLLFRCDGRLPGSNPGFVITSDATLRSNQHDRKRCWWFRWNALARRIRSSLDCHWRPDLG